MNSKEREQDLRGMGGIYSSRNLGLFSYAGNNPVILIDPNGKELAKIKFGSNSAFVNQDATIDRSFYPIVVGMNEVAKRRGIKIHLNQSFREEGVPLSNVVAGVTPANRSNHKVGRALDVNLYDSDGEFYNSTEMLPENASDNIKGFIEEVKGLTLSGEYDKDASPRWGGDFSTKDTVHFDMKTGYKDWNALFKENQEQYKDGDIPTWELD